MSSWVEELGAQKFTDKEVKFIVKITGLMAEVAEDNAKELNDFFNEKIDTAIYNLNLIKKEIGNETTTQGDKPAN